MVVKRACSAPKFFPALPLINSAGSGFFFCGIIEEPDNILSSILISLNISELQIINYSANLEICIAQIEADDKKSKAKSLSDTESIELFVGFLKPSFLEVKFLSIL